jgi:hypothetical protein
MSPENEKTVSTFDIPATSEKDAQKRQDYYKAQAEKFLEALKTNPIEKVNFPKNATTEDKNNFTNTIKDKNQITIPAPKEGQDAMEYYKNVMEEMRNGKLFGGAEKKQNWSGKISFEDEKISPEIHKMIDKELKGDKQKEGALKGTNQVSVSRAINKEFGVIDFIKGVINFVVDKLSFKDEKKEMESKFNAIIKYAIDNSKKEVGPEPLSNKPSNDVHNTLNSKIEKNNNSQLYSTITKTNYNVVNPRDVIRDAKEFIEKVGSELNPKPQQSIQKLQQIVDELPKLDLTFKADTPLPSSIRTFADFKGEMPKALQNAVKDNFPGTNVILHRNKEDNLIISGMDEKGELKQVNLGNKIDVPEKLVAKDGEDLARDQIISDLKSLQPTKQPIDLDDVTLTEGKQNSWRDKQDQKTAKTKEIPPSKKLNFLHSV